MKKDYFINGLNDIEVQNRIKLKQTNGIDGKQTKSYYDIFYSNIVNPFNILNFILAFLVFITGHYQNMLFMGVVISNSFMAIYQEIKVKIKLDKLKLLNAPHNLVIRNAKELHLSAKDLVLDDLLILKTGDQVLSDSILLEKELLVDESFITGEANEIIKKENDLLYAGSIIISGNSKARIIKVGKDNYINQILDNIKKAKSSTSALKDILFKFIKYISFIILPLGFILFIKQYYLSNLSFNDAIINSVASMIGMIPEGLILLTSLALGAGVIKLSKNNVLVSELYSLENLARIDTLCLDKTGTITTGEMVVKEIIKYEDFDLNIIANIYHQLNDQNQTANAIKDYLKINEKLNLDKLIPFTSKNKYSGAIYLNQNYLIGAPSFISDETIDINSYLNDGYRVLAISKNSHIIGLIIIEDLLRTNIKDTINYLYHQNINIKIISGDDPITVSKIAKKAAIKKYHQILDCSNITDIELARKIDSHTIFARVNPKQKLFIMQKLKSNKHITGMIGDGINDIMALKEADFSITFNSALDATKNIANAILLDDDFNHLIDIINQGRRVINNISLSATLFITKTCFSIILTICTILFLKEYPFIPIQLTLLSFFGIGLPSFILSFEPNYKNIPKTFIRRIIKKALIPSIIMTLVAIILELLSNKNLLDNNLIDTMYIIITAFILVDNIYQISKPLSKIRLILLCFIIIGLLFSFIFLKDIFSFSILDYKSLIISISFGIISILIINNIFKYTK